MGFYNLFTINTLEIWRVNGKSLCNLNNIQVAVKFTPCIRTFMDFILVWLYFYVCLDQHNLVFIVGSLYA
jgi:hypothetical protein